MELTFNASWPLHSDPGAEENALDPKRLRLSVAAAVIASLVAAIAAGSAVAGTVYSWETQEGTLAFTDDPKQIPAEYREAANAREFEALGDYARATRTSEPVVAEHATRVERRLSQLRGSHGAIALAAPGLRGSGASEAAFLVRTSGSSRGVATQVGFPVSSGPAGNPEPIVTDNVRVRSANGTTRHITVVRQGERILSVVRPQANETSATFPDERELLRRLGGR